MLNDTDGWARSSRHAEVCDIGRGPSDERDFNANLLVDSFLGTMQMTRSSKVPSGFYLLNIEGKGATMERRNALGLLGAAGFLSLRSASRSEANVPDAASPGAPPRLSVDDLIRLIGDKKFQFNSIYAHELEFRAITIIDPGRPVGADQRYERSLLPSSSLRRRPPGGRQKRWSSPDSSSMKVLVHSWCG